ncbi:hypothetical protein MCOR02_007596 [Pyricularia oryzae]|nr:hypothetical protein MCOR02_007596 [Pyricularia oryzae]KAI6316651.1 hypothetical protein MCOR34_004263 [Pyricularia oryzae]KAI6450232.1 hypothetical protein MCOR17_009979 [Pyricularia oryzae]KAI6510203.1 hypothetical protein MCOR13_001264 [Pyricularia oryzae]KAI6597534.1 hypothetical protein MCOR04_002763 [Pyricularia oryzae]
MHLSTSMQHATTTMVLALPSPPSSQPLTAWDTTLLQTFSFNFFLLLFFSLFLRCPAKANLHQPDKMQFKNMLLLASATSILAAPTTLEAPVANVDAAVPAIEFGTAGHIETQAAAEEPEHSLVERQAISGAIIGALTPILQDLATKAVNEAIKQAGIFIKDLRNWTAAREAFTQATVREMWYSNPDPAKYPAVVCYNKGYHLERPEGIAGWTKVELKTGFLHTDYDCMYMEGNNNFYTWSDGGFINYAFGIDRNRCEFDRSTGDILCR